MAPHLLVLTLALAAIVATPVSASPQPARGATLRVVVRDPSGAVIPSAAVHLTPLQEGEPADPLPLSTDGQGVAATGVLPAGRYRLEVSFPGFEPHTVPEMRLPAGDNRRDVTLAIRRVDESIAVGRDPSTSASDPNAERLGNVLTREQIDALPDDPEEMQRVLTEMAGPGGTIRVDGFRGGKLPPKALIRGIRFASGMFAAENHGGGMVFVDISTQPGAGPLRGSVELGFRDEALNARNAFQREKGPERNQQYTFTLAGTLIEERTSFSLSAGGAALYDSANIFAATSAGTRTAAVRRPSDRINVTGRLDHALTRSHTLRAMFQQSTTDQHNLGVGGFELDERAYARGGAETLVRLSESGPWSKALFGESRLQVRIASSDAAAATEAPAIRVLDAFTAGGAQQDGGRRAAEIEWAVNADWARGRHAVRWGSLVEAGTYRSDSRSNYLGTYTFTSLAEYEAGRAATYTRRDGDPHVEYSHWQTGLFLQDDWRARKNLTLSGGLRYEVQSHAGSRLNVAPRGGLTWSPFKHGRTTVRAGGGTFYDWLEAEVYEQTLRVDGTRQRELVVRNPGFPDLLDTGSPEVLPPGKYVLAEGLLLPRRHMVSAGLSQQIAPGVAFNLNLIAMTGTHRLRGRNTNAPLHGLRPDPAYGNVAQVESTARMRGRQVHAGINVNLPQRRVMMFANYAFADQRNDTDGPFSLPADSYDLAAEWGPAAGIPRHAASAVVNVPLAHGFGLGVTAAARSGTRYTITTGHDDNGDTVFNDRPAGTGRNSASGRASWDMAARLSYAFGFGERPSSGPGGAGPTVVVQRIGGGPSAGDLLGAPMGGGAENKRVRIELFVSAQNLLNSVTPIGYSGVLTSPFFGQPTAAMPARRIDVGMRVGF